MQFSDKKIWENDQKPKGRARTGQITYRTFQQSLCDYDWGCLVLLSPLAITVKWLNLDVMFSWSEACGTWPQENNTVCSLSWTSNTFPFFRHKNENGPAMAYNTHTHPPTHWQTDTDRKTRQTRQTNTHIYRHTHTPTHTCGHMHTHTHTQTFTDTHTHTFFFHKQSWRTAVLAPNKQTTQHTHTNKQINY